MALNNSSGSKSSSGDAFGSNVSATQPIEEMETEDDKTENKNELGDNFGELKKQIDELSKEISGLKMGKDKLLMFFGPIKFELIEMNNQKWNAKDRGPNLKIDGDGITAKHPYPFPFGIVDFSQLAQLKTHINTVRAKTAIRLWAESKTPSIAYFEAKIIVRDEHWDGTDVCIGFCDENFPLKDKLLGTQNSFGIFCKGGMSIEGNQINFDENDIFRAGDVIGIGIVHFPANSNFMKMKGFATCNGQLLGIAELPDDFSKTRLFPALSLLGGVNLVRANFGAEKWHYNPCETIRPADGNEEQQ